MLTDSDRKYFRDAWWSWLVFEGKEHLYTAGLLLFEEDEEFWFRNSFRDLAHNAEE